MPGVIYRVLSKTTYDFSTVAVSSGFTLSVARAIDVSGYREATLLLRIHAVSFNNTPTVKLDALYEDPTQEDPAADFIGTVSLAGISVPLSGLTVPFLTAAPISTPFGGFLRIKLTGSQGTPASNPFSVTLSADIVAKS
jgi:hypothetical protein